MMIARMKHSCTSYISKKITLFFFMAAFCCFTACGHSESRAGTDAVKTEAPSAETADIPDSIPEEGEEETMETESANRTMIAEALGIDEGSRNIRFILSCLDTVGAGRLQSAKLLEADGQKTIEIVAEDGINYCIYLTESGKVEAIQNLDTGEWPVRSEK